MELAFSANISIACLANYVHTLLLVSVAQSCLPSWKLQDAVISPQDNEYWTVADERFAQAFVNYTWYSCGRGSHDDHFKEAASREIPEPQPNDKGASRRRTMRMLRSRAVREGSVLYPISDSAIERDSDWRPFRKSNSCCGDIGLPHSSTPAIPERANPRMVLSGSVPEALACHLELSMLALSDLCAE